jgi:DNA-3-methyladenine glycosylase
MAMGITKSHYGIDLCGDTLFLTQGEEVAAEQIGVSPRINIDYAGEAKHNPWRFYVKNNKFVSKP